MSSCAKCERPFRYGTEDTVTINKKTYHSDCLSCDKCSKAYDGSFTPDQLDQEALCRECNHASSVKSATNNVESKKRVSFKPSISSSDFIFVSTPRCGGCGLPFNPASRHITKRYNNKEYHYNCLKCQECQSLIEGEIYEDERENKMFCTNCFKTRDQKSFQKQNQEKKKNQQKSVHFAEKLAETLNRDELEAYYKNDQQQRNNDSFLMGTGNQSGEIRFCAACMLPFHYGSRITQANDREYHYECFSCNKCRQAINGAFTVTPDGRQFICAKCIQKTYSSSMKVCNECGQGIEPGVHTRIDFNNRSFHSECFTCAICHRPLNSTRTYTLHGDQPWCHQCEVDTKDCFSCGKPILSAGIAYETRDYHVECFRCSHCNKSLENEKLLCANNLKPYCVACNDQLFAKRCAKCGKPIPHDTRYTTFEDKPFHEQCFLCAKCHRPIGSKKFFKEPRGFICSNCGNS